MKKPTGVGESIAEYQISKGDPFTEGWLTLHASVFEGLPFGRVEELQEILGVDRETLAEWTGISDRTLSRRRKEGRLSIDESDRILRIARIAGQAERLFEGDLPAARQWLEAPRSALGGLTPRALLRTEVGAREVETLIGRLEQGVFA